VRSRERAEGARQQDGIWLVGGWVGSLAAGCLGRPFSALTASPELDSDNAHLLRPSIYSLNHRLPTQNPQRSMAILPAIPGLGVSILVRGIRAVEYDDPDQEEGAVGADVTADFDIPEGSINLPVPHAVKYIEAEPDAPFSIHVVKTPVFQRLSHNIGCRLLIDGQSGIFVDEGYDGTPQELWMATLNSQYSGSETAGWKRHKFVFSALRLVEGAGPSGAAVKHQTSLLEGCGTLKLLFYHMDWCCVDWNSPWGTARPPDLGPAELSEKQLKGKAIDCSAR